MNILQQLSSEDFYIGQSSKGGKILCINQKGLVLALFHLNPDRCKWCEEVIPDFKRLPQIQGNCKYALVNLNKFPDVAKMAKTTIAPIDYVPYIVFYVDGKPFIRYEGDRTIKDITEFINDVLTRIQTKRSFSDTKNAKMDTDIPVGSFGIPYSVVCDQDKGVCYLTHAEAYKK